MESRVCRRPRHPLLCFESRVLIGRSSALTGPCCCRCSVSLRPNWFDGSGTLPSSTSSLSFYSLLHPPRPPPPLSLSPSPSDWSGCSVEGCTSPEPPRVCMCLRVLQVKYLTLASGHTPTHTHQQALTRVSGGEQRPCGSADVLQVAMECRRFELTEVVRVAG